MFSQGHTFHWPSNWQNWHFAQTHPLLPHLCIVKLSTGKGRALLLRIWPGVIKDLFWASEKPTKNSPSISGLAMYRMCKHLIAKNMTMILLLQEQFWGEWGRALLSENYQASDKEEKKNAHWNISILLKSKAHLYSVEKPSNPCMHRLKSFWIRLSPALKNKHIGLCSCLQTRYTGIIMN